VGPINLSAPGDTIGMTGLAAEPTAWTRCNIVGLSIPLPDPTTPDRSTHTSRVIASHRCLTAAEVCQTIDGTPLGQVVLHACSDRASARLRAMAAAFIATNQTR
jgi:hypothetical protein